MIHVWTVVCTQSSIDSTSNNITLFEVIEQLNVPNPFPTPEPGKQLLAPIGLEVVTLWARTDDLVPERSECKVRFSDPKGTTILERSFEANLTGHVRNRHRLRINGLPLTVPGRYTFHVDAKTPQGWKEFGSVPLQVKPADGAKPG